MKQFLKQIKNGFILSYTGRLGNIIDFQSYKTNKLVNKYCNNPKISAILVIIILAVALCYYFS